MLFAKGDGNLKEDGGLLSDEEKHIPPIKEGLKVTLREMLLPKESMRRNDYYIEHLESHIRDEMEQKIKEVRSPKKVPYWMTAHKLFASRRRDPPRILVSG